MHIAEGVLSWPVLATGGGLAVAGVTLGLRRLDNDRVPMVGVLSAAFFVASLIHFPLGPTSVHLLLSGLLGILLGWVAFPTIFVALLLQALLFQYGGFTTLGVNTVVMAAPAVIASCLYRPFAGTRRPRPALAYTGAFLCGSLGVMLGAFLMGLALVWGEEELDKLAEFVFVVHLPQAALEGFITATAVGFLRTVKPELLGGNPRLEHICEK